MLTIRYVDQDLQLDIPEANLLFNQGPLEMAPVSDPIGRLIQAIRNPIGTPTLDQLLTPGQKVILIVDDNTRITPTMQIIPVVLDELNRAGILDSDIRAIIASGTHRLMTPSEKEQKYGSALMSRIPFLDHQYKDLASLVDFGTTKRGTRVWVNRSVIEADFRLAIGNIIPHHPTGWSAGAKAVLPGVAGEETVAQMHFLGSRWPSLGSVDTPMRQEMEDFASVIGLDFIFNVILNRQGKLIDAVSGHYIKAHRIGVEISKKVYGIPIPRIADLVVSSSSPVDFDFFQADKGITSAELATRLGGEIILVAGCVEGISPAHPDLANYLQNMTREQIWSLVERGDAQDPLTVAEAIVINDIKNKMNITLATDGILPEVCKKMGFTHVRPSQLNAYIHQHIKDHPEIRIGILHQSAEVLPVLDDKYA